MGNAENGKGNVTNDHNAVESQSQSKEETEKEKTMNDHRKENKRVSCLKSFYVILGILAVTVSVAMIIVTILTSIATRAYDADQSSRIAAMVLLAVTAAVAICMVIYMEVATFKCESRPMSGSAAVILILAIVQALISGLTVNVEPADEANLLKSLAESFKLAKDEVPRHYKLWSMTQYDLNCCGIYGPDDYRTKNQPFYFPPDVPISCCPAYDPDRSDLVQERERELCKAKKTYYNVGCQDLVLTVLHETSTIVLTVTIILIISEVIFLIVGMILYKRLKNNKVDQSPNQIY